MFLVGFFLAFASQHFQIQAFHPLPSPRGFSKKGKTGLDRRVVGKASDGYPLAELLPAVRFHQVLENGVQTKAMKGVFGLIFQF